MLINNRKPPPEDVDEGIDHDSPLFKAIMSNPVVQLGLNNPRCLLGMFIPIYFRKTVIQIFSLYQFI